ncbi:MAG TPA: GNAT family N-acetyltransferase [Phycisphaerales bacterium]
MQRPPDITLRRTRMDDVPLLHAFELDEAANAMAGTKPRDWGAFSARWAAILGEGECGCANGATGTGVTPRVIVLAGKVVGAINIVHEDGAASIGYWIARTHWGRGIASRAVGLMLEECRIRPLLATASAGNTASLRVLEKHGFVAIRRERTAETARTVERETVTLRLEA